MSEKASASPVFRSSWFRVALSLVLGAVLVGLVARTVNFGEVYRIIVHASAMPLIIALLAFVIDFVLRAVRFWAMLRLSTNRSFPLRPAIAPFIASFGISDLLPLRIGDGFRVVWFCREYSIPAGTVIGTMVVERILDLVTLVALGALAMLFVGTGAAASLVWNFKLVLIVATIAGGILLFAPNMLHTLVQVTLGRFTYPPFKILVKALGEIWPAVKQIGSRRHLIWLFAMSLALWLLESIVLIGAWVSLGGELRAVFEPLIAFVFSTLGTLVPSLPGHFGSFEYFGLQAFALSGVDASLATAILLLAHLILWAPTALFAVVWLAFRLNRTGSAIVRQKQCEP